MSEALDEVILEEEMALTVDHRKMAEKIKDNLPDEPYAYIKDMITIATQTDATKLDIKTSLGKIVLQDNGKSLPKETLIAKLATIFTSEGRDYFASSVAAAFNTEVKEILIEAAPQGEEPYAMRIICEDDIPDVYEVDLEKKIDRGTRVTLFKYDRIDEESTWQKVSRNAALLLYNHHPEVKRIKQSCKGCKVDVSLNRRKLKKPIEQKECLVEVDIKHDEIKGRIGLLKEPDFGFWKKTKRNCETYYSAKSTIHIFRQGFYHSTLSIDQQPFRLCHGPIYAELDYHKIPVDITGKELQNGAKESMQKIDDAIRQSLPGLYEKLLEMEDSPHRRDHLLHITALNLYEIARDWPSYPFRPNPIYIREDYRRVPSSPFSKNFHKKLLQEKLYKTDEQGMMDLEQLLTVISDYDPKKSVFLDNRGYDYSDVGGGDIVVTAYEHSDISAIVLAGIEDIHILPGNGRLDYRVYKATGSPEAEEREQRVETMKQKVKVPLLYRPAEITYVLYDVCKEQMNLQTPADRLRATLPAKRTATDMIKSGAYKAGFFLPMLVAWTPTVVVYTALGAAETTIKACNLGIDYLVTPTFVALGRGCVWLDKRMEPVISAIGQKAEKIGGYLGTKAQIAQKATGRATSTALVKTKGGLEALVDKTTNVLKPPVKATGNAIKTAALATTGVVVGGVAAVGAGLSWAVTTSYDLVKKGAGAGYSALEKSVKFCGRAGYRMVTEGYNLLSSGYQKTSRKTKLLAERCAAPVDKMIKEYQTTLHGQKDMQKGTQKENNATNEYETIVTEPIVTDALQQRRQKKTQKQQEKEKKTAEKKKRREDRIKQRIEEKKRKKEAKAEAKQLKIEKSKSTLHAQKITAILTALKEEPAFPERNIFYISLADEDSHLGAAKYADRLYVNSQSWYNQKLFNIAGRAQGMGSFQDYLGNYFIEEAGIGKYVDDVTGKDIPRRKAIQDTLIQYQKEILENRQEEFYQGMISDYVAGEVQSFKESYLRLDDEGKVQVIYSLLKGNYQTTAQDDFDRFFDLPKNQEILAEAGRRRIEEARIIDQ